MERWTGKGGWGWGECGVQEVRYQATKFCSNTSKIIISKVFQNGGQKTNSTKLMVIMQWQEIWKIWKCNIMKICNKMWLKKYQAQFSVPIFTFFGL